MDDAVVERYCRQLRAAAQTDRRPTVLLYEVKSAGHLRSSTLFVLDGHHKLAAAQRLRERLNFLIISQRAEPAEHRSGVLDEAAGVYEQEREAATLEIEEQQLQGKRGKMEEQQVERVAEGALSLASTLARAAAAIEYATALGTLREAYEVVSTLCGVLRLVEKEEMRRLELERIAAQRARVRARTGQPPPPPPPLDESEEESCEQDLSDLFSGM